MRNPIHPSIRPPLLYWTRLLIVCHSRAFVSFGRLLLYIEGPYAKLSPLLIDHVYLLMKR
jgi:RNA polymerase Rpb8